MYQNIIKNITKCIELTDTEKELFTSSLEKKEISKKTILLREGEICQFEGYIEKGCARVYYISENGFEVTVYFATEDWWISDIASFYEKTPSKFYIETLEDSTIYFLNPTVKERLLTSIPKLERVFRMLVQRDLSTLQNRLINTFSKSATERYLDFISTYPEVVKRVPQYYIASYLGISAEFISTIRKRLSEKH